MSYDEELAERLRAVFRERHDLVEKKLFGGLGFLLAGNLCVAVWKDCLMTRVGPDAYAAALEEPHVREFDITGRPMRGWVMVEPEGLETAEQLREWVSRSLRFVEGLPGK
ncbi:MAG: TfoX/Sxy family protein [Bryobacteraceae bacterium]|nr:TfoX/Sxy family protein [Planctomycetia bacterium]MDZ4802697.1 TfoX/Sxy family protein [Bryobacteraceae bacterium]